MHIIPIAVLAIGLVLVLVLRSLIAPLYLIVSVVLSYLASLGLSVLFFMKIGGQGGHRLPLTVPDVHLPAGAGRGLQHPGHDPHPGGGPPAAAARGRGAGRRGHRPDRDLGRPRAGRHLRRAGRRRRSRARAPPSGRSGSAWPSASCSTPSSSAPSWCPRPSRCSVGGTGGRRRWAASAHASHRGAAARAARGARAASTSRSPTPSADGRRPGGRQRRRGRAGALTQAPDPGDHRRAHARHVPGRARPDRRLDGAADHRRRPARGVPPDVGGHRLPAVVDGVDAAVGQARRPVRAQARSSRRRSSSSSSGRCCRGSATP